MFPRLEQVLYLESLLTIGRVNVTYTSGTSLCTTDGSNNATITFLTELGDLPMLSLAKVVSSDGVTTSITIEETTRGTKEDLECSDLGTCDRTTGLCSCFDGFHAMGVQGHLGCEFRLILIFVVYILLSIIKFYSYDQSDMKQVLLNPRMRNNVEEAKMFSVCHPCFSSHHSNVPKHSQDQKFSFDVVSSNLCEDCSFESSKHA